MKRALILAAVLAGCGTPRTEVVVVVHSSGVRIPDDVDSLRLQISDRVAGAGDDLLFDQPVPLCSDVTAGSPDCYPLPVTLTLFPGSMRPHDSVRVQVDAQRQGVPKIADAALFTFSEGHSLRLDVILYANCLGNVDCAKRDQACGPDDMCQVLVPGPLGDEPDLAQSDMSISDGPPLADLTNVHDFTVPPDMTLPDLSGVDLLNCVPQCGGKQCGFDGCQGTCGNCGTHGFCDVGQICSACGSLGQACCSSAQLPPMGCDTGLECDTNSQCNVPPDLMPPPPDMTACGQLDEPCCDGVTCFSGMCMFNLMCEMPDMSIPDSGGEGGVDLMISCGSFGSPCCPGSPDYCVNGFICMGGFCMNPPG